MERLSHMEAQLKASEDDGFRLRSDRDRLRERVSELQAMLKEKQAEVSGWSSAGLYGPMSCCLEASVVLVRLCAGGAGAGTGV